MKRVRENLSYANVVATVALVIALVGIPSAVAVTLNLSKKSDITKKGKIKKNSVTGADVRDGTIHAADIADGQVGAAELAPTESANVLDTSGGVGAMSCPSGQRMLSGGIGEPAGGGMFESFPLNTNQWFASTDASGNFRIYVLCLHAAP